MSPKSNREPLTTAVCYQLVIQSTPRPKDFPANGDPSKVKLFNLGVVDATTGALFAQAVSDGMPTGWSISTSRLASAPNTSVQAAAISIQNNAV
jgi:hypothetical protein